jgi:emp24/gp25L/p24 family/GOLD
VVTQISTNYYSFEFRTDNESAEYSICIKPTDSNKKWVDINYVIQDINSGETRNNLVEVLKKDAGDIFTRLNGISNFIHALKKNQEYSLSGN